MTLNVTMFTDTTQTLDEECRAGAYPCALAMLFGLKLSRWVVMRLPVPVRV